MKAPAVHFRVVRHVRAAMSRQVLGTCEPEAACGGKVTYSKPAFGVGGIPSWTDKPKAVTCVRCLKSRAFLVASYPLGPGVP